MRIEKYWLYEDITREKNIMLPQIQINNHNNTIVQDQECDVSAAAPVVCKSKQNKCRRYTVLGSTENRTLMFYNLTSSYKKCFPLQLYSDLSVNPTLC